MTDLFLLSGIESKNSIKYGIVSGYFSLIVNGFS